MPISIPPYVMDVLNCLEACGFEAFVVGGCVRDSFMGVEPGDWDVCTSATPEEMERCFSGFRVIETGLKHGTLTVRSRGENVEVTAYRVDGEYRDHRRPESVEFVRRLDMDLMRRDFTVNAMAYSPARGLVDLFGGRDDLKRRLIRCVGEPRERFEEDALRLLRALRFAARFGFDIEEETARALREKAPQMAAVAAERIFAEWKKLVVAPASRRILADYAEVFDGWMPGLDAGRAGAIGWWDALPPEAHIRTALLCRDGAGLCRFFKADTAFKTRVLQLVKCEKEPLPGAPDRAMRFLAEYGEDTLSDRLALARARGEEAEDCLNALERAKEEGRVWQVEKLAATGSDLMTLGLAGPDLGRMRKTLLEDVMDGRVQNEKRALMERAKSLGDAGAYAAPDPALKGPVP